MGRVSAEHSAGSKTKGIRVAGKALIVLLRLLWSKEIGQSQYLQYADACSLSVVGAVTARRIVDFALLTFALLNVDLHV